MTENEIYLASAQKFIRKLIDDKTDQDYKKDYEKLCVYHQEVPLLMIREVLDMDSLQYFILLINVMYEIDVKFVRELGKQYGKTILCFQIILHLYQKIYGVSYEQIMHGWIHRDCELLYKKEDALHIMDQQFILHREVLFYILSNQLPFIFGCIQYDEFIGFQIFNETFQQLDEQLEHTSVVQLQGFEGNGRSSLAIRYALSHKRICMVLDMRTFTYTDGFLFTAVLQNACICMRNINIEDMDTKEMLKVFQRYGLSVILCVYKEINEYPCILLPQRLTKKERVKFEKAYAKKNDFLPGEYTNLRTVITPPKFVSCEKKQVYFEDLILEKDHVDRLHHILYMMQHVHENESCLSFLFHGPSGTGKTLCAKMLGSEANMPLWKVNLSMILDKYVGESEKHLEELFHKAQQANCVLLFDEADVLFAKRTDISSSNDRYANTSTAYLLQKMESYPGIIILTTNFIHNFDDAFLRRMKLILRFPEASHQQRMQKWKACFQPYLTLTQTDLERLGNLQELTLASIENVCEHAVIFWKRRESEHMEFNDIKKAIDLEFEKLQKRIPSNWL